MTKMQKTRILTIMEMRTAAIKETSFPGRTCESASCFFIPKYAEKVAGCQSVCNELPVAGPQYVKWVDKDRRLSVRYVSRKQ